MRCLGWAWALCWFFALCFAGPARAEDEIKVIRVCVRPPNVPPNVVQWTYALGTASLMTSDAEVFAMKAHGNAIWVFDPYAPEEHNKLFPIPYHTLRCPAHALPTKPPERPKLRPKEDDEREGNDAPKSDKKPGRSDGAPKNDKKPGNAEAKDKGAAEPMPMPLPLPPKQEEHRRHPPPESTWLEEEVLPRKGVLSSKGVLSDSRVLPTKYAGSPITSAGTGKKPVVEKSLAAQAAEQLALAGGLANMQTEDDDPNGKPFGIPGGKNLNGPNTPTSQAAAGGVLVVIAVLSATGLESKLKEAVKAGKSLVLKGTGKLSEAAAEQLAKKWGYSITHALCENGTIAEYKVMSKFTQKMGGRWQAHHLLERRMVQKFGLGNAEEVPSVILTEAAHKAMTRKLAARMAEVQSKGELLEAYREVYAGHPHWLKAIESYLGM